MLDSTKTDTNTQDPAPGTSRVYFIGRRRLEEKVFVYGRVYVKWSLLWGTVLTDAYGVVVFRTWRRFVIDRGRIYA